MAYFNGGNTTLASTGNTVGVCTVTDPSFLVPGATVYLSATGLATMEVLVTSVNAATVSLRKSSVMQTTYGTDISAYTTALGASIYMPGQSVWGSTAVAGGTGSSATASTGLASGYIADGAPAFNVAISTVSVAVTGLTPGATYRIACSVPAFFRAGVTGLTATTSDAPIFGPSVEYISLRASDTALAFVCPSGSGTVVGNLLSNVP